ncbi:MAG: signal peptidase [Planctomycetaceae bacterium]|jgi:cell fate regulator YaaT (PSP1 superfamily)|nr:signal peptidase [Planctomycetaceae bacterium]
MIKYIVRYGAMRILGVFTYPEHTTLPHGQHVIVRTTRGQEIGTVLCQATPEIIAEIKGEWIEDRVIRPMTEADKTEQQQIQTGEKDEFIRCRNIIRKMEIAMDLVRVEHVFGGERIIVYYVAEGRVDFRELVKVLAAEFQTRVEMRQIGVRDETKLLADFGDCGKEVCCNWYLTEMPPVSMKMAKLQKATLDPTKISGRCGRLKCCLRYEYDHYVETQKELPPINCHVNTEEGEGKVVAQEILARKVIVEINDRGRKMFCPKSLQILSYDPPDKLRNEVNDVTEGTTEEE